MLTQKSQLVQRPLLLALNMADVAPAPLDTPTDLNKNDTRTVGDALNVALADAYALYIKTKNYHWHVSGPHFRDYHLMLDEQAAQILAVGSAGSDPLADAAELIDVDGDGFVDLSNRGVLRISGPDRLSWLHERRLIGAGLTLLGIIPVCITIALGGCRSGPGHCTARRRVTKGPTTERS